MKNGFSILEVILAVAIFMIFATTAVIVVTSGYNANRQGSEYTVATQFAAEGIEAAKSIKNRGYSLLTTSSCTSGTGLTQQQGVWTLSGANNIFDKYTRVINICNVNRDAQGNIASSGTLDPYTKKITSLVSWNFSQARNNSVSLVTYLTHWRKPTRGGMLVYGDGSTTSDTMMYRILNVSGTWGDAAPIDFDTSATNKALRAVRVYSSPTRNEKIAISRHFNGTQQLIYAHVFNGTIWNSILLASWNSSTYDQNNQGIKNFDGDYLTNGDFMAVFSDNSSAPQARVWNGYLWSSMTLPQITDIPSYIVARARPGTNEVMVAVFDQRSYVNSLYYNGLGYSTNNWVVHPRHSTNAPTNYKEHIDFAWSPYNPLKGALVHAFGQSDKGLNLKSFTANGTGGGSWDTIIDNTPDSPGRLGSVALDARKGAEEVIACQKDASSGIYCYRGTIRVHPFWAPVAYTATTTSDSGDQRSFDVRHEATGETEALVVYSNNTATPKYKLFTVGGSFGLETDLTPPLSTVVKSVRLRPFVEDDDIMVLMADGNRRFYTVVWDGTANTPYTSSGRAFTAQGTNGSGVSEFWYDFAWDRQ